MPGLQEDTLIVFVSDSHIGGDPGCDGFESPEELEDLFEELAGHEGPVELILAGDFFDFLQISGTKGGLDRAEATISRPEYEEMFAALARFRSEEGKRVIYLPGNHDAEMWWNPRIQETLKKRGLVDEFALNYVARLEVGGERRLVYCEHGNQLDAANTIGDYGDPLDTPLGHHVVTDFTRRVAPYGEISPGLDLSEIKMVYPLTAIPGWVASRYFYDAVGLVAGYLLFPLLVVYAVYRVAAFLIARSDGSVSNDLPQTILGSYQELPLIHQLFLDVASLGLLTVAIFAIFFLVVRREVRRATRAVSLRQKTGYSPAAASLEKVRKIVLGEEPPPMGQPEMAGEMDVFVSGHTHLPSLDEVQKPDGNKAVMVNSGCWLRQLQPGPARFKGPPIFLSRFVLTHVRVFVRDGALRVELWESPKPAVQSLTRTERFLSRGQRGAVKDVDSGGHVRASATL